MAPNIYEWAAVSSNGDELLWTERCCECVFGSWCSHTERVLSGDCDA